MTFQDDITRMLDEGYASLLAAANEHLPSGAPELLIDPALITVKRVSAFLPMSTEQLLDMGLITEEQARAQGWTPYVPLPVPWHRRARWRWQSWRERAGRRVGGWLAGVDLSERDED